MTQNDPIVLSLSDEAQTIRLGEDLALALKAGDCLALSGDLGAGKSTLARAVLRAMADDAELEVPSPTFTLVQSYDLRIPVAHFDLYRLADGSELDELGFDEALSDGICLVEWPQMADAELPADRIRLSLSHDGEGRRAEFSGPALAMNRIRRVLSIRQFLDRNGHGHDRRRFLTGDASLRAYERLHAPDGKSFVLMDWPRRPDGPIVMNGLSYPKLAHLAEDIAPFMAIAGYLHRCGLKAPAVLASDRENGLLLLEDLGSDGVLDAAGEPIAERYLAAVDCLAQLHGTPVQNNLPVMEGLAHTIPDFDPLAMKIETSLVLDWYLPWKRNGAKATDAERQTYLEIWDNLIEQLGASERHLLLRDYHSPNLIWQPDETGVRRVGLIDFQDAMIGPTAYDVASLVFDARVTVPEVLRAQLLARYIEQRHAQGAFDEAGFAKAFAIMAAQRNCKLAGIWVRLKQRDGKPGYLKHMPRTIAYLQSALEHPALIPLRQWLLEAGMDLSES
jgi:N-acetylmuramate 1-kinase